MMWVELMRCGVHLWRAWGVLLLVRTTAVEATAEMQHHHQEKVWVGSYNIRTASEWAKQSGGDVAQGRTWSVRRSRVAKSIEIGKASIVGTQEGLRWQLDELAASLGESWRWVGGGRIGDGGDDDEHAGILYDETRVELVETADFWLSPTPEKSSLGWGAALPRVATTARFRVAGTELVVLNTHFDHASENARTESAALVRTVAARLGVDVVMGDFNAPKDEKWYDELTRDHSYVDAWPLAAERFFGSAGQSTFHNWQGGSRATANWIKPFVGPESDRIAASGARHIDAVFVASRLLHRVRLTKARLVTDDRRRKVYGGPFASDHYPVLVELAFNNNSPLSGAAPGARGAAASAAADDAPSVVIEPPLQAEQQRQGHCQRQPPPQEDL